MRHLMKLAHLGIMRKFLQALQFYQWYKVLHHALQQKNWRTYWKVGAQKPQVLFVWKQPAHVSAKSLDNRGVSLSMDASRELMGALEMRSLLQWWDAVFSKVCGSLLVGERDPQYASNTYSRYSTCCTCSLISPALPVNFVQTVCKAFST